jgi:hypothetical protein
LCEYFKKIVEILIIHFIPSCSLNSANTVLLNLNILIRLSTVWLGFRKKNYFNGRDIRVIED